MGLNRKPEGTAERVGPGRYLYRGSVIERDGYVWNYCTDSGPRASNTLKGAKRGVDRDLAKKDRSGP